MEKEEQLTGIIFHISCLTIICPHPVLNLTHFTSYFPQMFKSLKVLILSVTKQHEKALLY